jgi:hypothetical protein
VEPSLSDEDHLARNLANLRAYFDSIVRCFGDRIDTALSGGYDSRLTLALLLERGISPSIHVYGRPGDADVMVAKHVAANEGFALSHVDKSTFAAVEPDAFPDVVERNFQAFHGHPSDGVFENGSDLTTRTELCRGGRLMLNGGGGEVFRNFFYLPDRSFSVRQILWAFYSRFDPATCTRLFEPERYYRALEHKVRKTLGVGGKRLSRPRTRERAAAPAHHQGSQDLRPAADRQTVYLSMEASPPGPPALLAQRRLRRSGARSRLPLCKTVVRGDAGVRQRAIQSHLYAGTAVREVSAGVRGPRRQPGLTGNTMLNSRC